MQILRKRNLILGNLVLGLVFALVAYSAVRPLFKASLDLTGIEDVQVVSSQGRTLEQESEHHLAMRTEYPKYIIGNDIFVAKVPKPPPPKIKVTPKPPLVKPNWSLAGIWEPDPGVFEATIIDKSRKPGEQELIAHEGDRFTKHMVVITEVTADYVRYEIRDTKYDRVVEQFLPPEAARTANKLQKDWSATVTTVRTNNYAVDMKKFVAEFEKLAGEDGDWVEALIKTVKAEPQGDPNALEGLKVLSFAAESPLDELGVQPQDILVGFVKEPITSAAQGRDLLRKALDKDEVRLHVNRLGKPVYIMIKLSRF